LGGWFKARLGNSTVPDSTGACTSQLGCGTVFSLSVVLGPFVETNPVVGKVGANVTILRTDLSGTTTGAVNVVTPGVAVSSNVPFRMLP
jgi:hypothetical protein